jgi:hypothetical protein
MFLAACFLIFAPMFVFGQGSSGGGAAVPDTDQVSIIGKKGPSGLETKVEPFAHLRISRMAKMLWVNNAETDIRVKVGHAVTCAEMSGAAFSKLEGSVEQKCYLSDSVKPKGTLEIQFREPGEYKYIIEYLEAGKIETGIVTVY